jgi:alkanesulfonate monooxygenase SsuD/methylene tetrahydromethanopterin reductase-like flavin-dependent oxidoreductase (luciferase family)
MRRPSSSRAWRPAAPDAVGCGQGELEQAVQLDLAQDPVHVVALGRVGLGVQAGVAVHGQAGQRAQGRLVVVAQRVEQGFEQVGGGGDAASLLLLGGPGRSGPGRGPARGGRPIGHVGTGGEREADVEQHLEGGAVLGPLDQGHGQRGAELGPVGQVHVVEGGDGVEHLDHGHGHAGVAQAVEELQQRGLERARRVVGRGPWACNRSGHLAGSMYAIRTNMRLANNAGEGGYRMPPARPTSAPPGRLVRLGVVLDTRNPIGRLSEIARMCDRIGIAALWVEDAPEPTSRFEPWTTLALLAPAIGRAHVGVLLDTGRRPPATLAAMAATLGAATGDRLELCLRDPHPAEVEAFLEALAVTAVPAGLGDGGSSLSAAVRTEPAPRPRLSVEPVGPGQLAWAVGLADDLLLPGRDAGAGAGGASATVEQVLAAAGAARRACQAAGRDPATLGIAARLPVSIGRTTAEAHARWQAEPAFAGLGRPEEVAIFGTLERCHDRVIELAHAGVTDLRCLLPNSLDVHDVIAQVTAMTIGTVTQLAPGAPRSPAPEPPVGWGGRPRHRPASPA